jgi:biopolymer transport protein ExbD
MAEISQQSADGSKGKVRTTKRSTKIDMTPMVDLAFLLLTFFILTTTFLKPHALDLPMPDDSGPQSPISGKNILNVVLAENNKIYWWDGVEGKVQPTNYSRNGLRKLLLEKKSQNPSIMVLIKPKDHSKYENMVDILDEVTITSTPRYAIVKFTNDDRDRLAEIGQ